MACGSPSDTGNYICRSTPFLPDEDGKNRCYQPSATKYEHLLFAEDDTARECRWINNGSKDCREACDRTTSCFYAD